MWNPHFTVHCTAVSYELKHVSVLSMLVFYFRGHAFVVYLRTIKVHNDSVFKELTVHFSRNPTYGTPPYLRISKRKYLPMPSEFHNREPPLPFGNPKSRPWWGYGYFLESPNIYLLFFSQASERAGCLNPRIWLANLTHVTGPAFYDTAHGPDFFPPPALLPKFRS